MSADDPDAQAHDAGAGQPGSAKAWVVVLLSNGGAYIRPAQRIQLRRIPMEPHEVTVVLLTRYDDAGLTDPIPRELVLEIHLPEAADSADAIALAGTVASGMVTFLSFAVNAFVPPGDPYVAFESAPGLSSRRFWQRDVTLQTGIPGPARPVDETLLFPLLRAFFTSPESARIFRTVSQYHVALSHWSTRGQPLALAHLYMAL